MSLEEAQAGREVEVEFLVTYRMDIEDSVKDIEIAVGVLSGLAVLLAAVEAWSWSRRYLGVEEEGEREEEEMEEE